MKTAIIGSGNMGGAIARSLASHPDIGVANLTCTAHGRQTLDNLLVDIPGIYTTTDNREAVSGAELVVLAVKPWILPEVIGQIRDLLVASRPIVVSVAAGVSLDDLEGMICGSSAVAGKNAAMFGGMSSSKAGDGGAVALFRAIPNTAISVGRGMTFLVSRNASPEQEKLVQGMFETMGAVMVVDEKKLEAGTALASCGIAYALRYIRAATEGGVQLGFKAEDAQEIVCRTVEGAVALLEANRTNPEVEIDKVTTPGGITIRGLNEMERKGFTAAVVDGLLASK